MGEGGGEGLLQARSNWHHAVAVTLPIIGESNKIKLKKTFEKGLQIQAFPDFFLCLYNLYNCNSHNIKFYEMQP